MNPQPVSCVWWLLILLIICRLSDLLLGQQQSGGGGGAIMRPYWAIAAVSRALDATACCYFCLFRNFCMYLFNSYMYTSFDHLMPLLLTAFFISIGILVLVLSLDADAVVMRWRAGALMRPPRNAPVATWAICYLVSVCGLLSCLQVCSGWRKIICSDSRLVEKFSPRQDITRRHSNTLTYRVGYHTRDLSECKKRNYRCILMRHLSVFKTRCSISDSVQFSSVLMCQCYSLQNTCRQAHKTWFCAANLTAHRLWLTTGMCSIQ